MPVQKLYRVQCGDCLRFLAPLNWAHLAATVHPHRSPLFTSYQDAQATALERGWSVYPLACPRCKPEKEVNPE